MKRWVCYLMAALWAAQACAEMDAADYQINDVIESGVARDRVKAEIARDIDRQAQQAQRQAEDEARRHAAAQAEAARRPYAERLLQARCTVCHPADNYLHQRHTSFGWHLVIGRMRHLNRAPVSWDEQSVLAAELARIRPARPLDAAAEYGAGLVALAAPLALGWGLNGWRRASSAARKDAASRG